MLKKKRSKQKHINQQAKGSVHTDLSHHLPYAACLGAGGSFWFISADTESIVHHSEVHYLGQQQLNCSGIFYKGSIHVWIDACTNHMYELMIGC